MNSRNEKKVMNIIVNFSQRRMKIISDYRCGTKLRSGEDSNYAPASFLTPIMPKATIPDHTFVPRGQAKVKRKGLTHSLLL